jgi:hypothetical protein
VDEFQNFATDSFATILSEARKYGLCLTVANQYTAQMPMEVKDAVFGNVGSIIAFRMSADDARTMLKYFEPKFLEYDLIHAHNRHFVISMTIEGEKTPAFSAISLNLPPQQGSQVDFIVEHSRALYASSREVVEHYVGERYLDMGKDKSGGKEQPKANPAKVAEPAPAKLSPQRSEQLPQETTLKHTANPEALAHAAIAGEVAMPNVAPAATPAYAPAAADAAEKPKRKRTRRRKRKPSEEGENSEQSASVDQPKPAANSQPQPHQNPKPEKNESKVSAHPQEFTDTGVVHLK